MSSGHHRHESKKNPISKQWPRNHERVWRHHTKTEQRSLTRLQRDSLWTFWTLCDSTWLADGYKRGIPKVALGSASCVKLHIHTHAYEKYHMLNVKMVPILSNFVLVQTPRKFSSSLLYFLVREFKKPPSIKYIHRLQFQASVSSKNISI